MKEGTAIVVSPLIALMKNQVDAIRGISENQGIAHVLNSSLNKTEISQVKSDIESGVTKLLYVAPESLIKEEYVAFLRAQKFPLWPLMRPTVFQNGVMILDLNTEICERLSSRLIMYLLLG